ncbi:TolC family protein [Aridibaculum aurantiacum]|uniref:TolC family protein n=1 Tax=Aridibaculum aurantiacum TaxID=2810307 RepID=UPI001A9699E1|nr:TolC family protein [Aridibaculum aurantiacum]
MMQRIKWMISLLVVAPVLSFAQQDTVLSLPGIIQKIDSNNLLLQTYGLRAESYKYSAEAATAWMAPMVGMGTWQTPYPGQKIMDARDRGMVMIRAEQDIPNLSKQRAKSRFIESQGNVELASRGVTLNELRTQAKRQYYTWLVALQRIKVLQRNQQVLAMMKKIEEVRYPYNQSALSSIYRSDAEIERNRNMVQMQLGEIERAKAILNSLMNRPGNQQLMIDTTYNVRFKPEAAIDTAQLSAERSDIYRMNENIRSMLLNIDAMRQESKPDFKVQFDHMMPLSRMMPNAYSIMGMISIPIAPWASRMYKSDIKAMQLNIQSMERERAAMLQETQGMLYGMQAEIQSMQRRLSTIETKVLPALQKTFDANYLVYQENKLSVTALLDSYEALNMMQMDLLDEKLKFYQMIVDYEKELYR